MARIEVVEATDLDYEAYSRFQKEAFRGLLDRSGVSDSFMTSEFYHWKYHTPVGYGRIARVLEGTEVISSSAMMPLRICDGDMSVIGWQCLDVATIPRARRKGHFFSTLKALVGSLEPNEIFFAFPNSSAISAFTKLGCRENVLLTTWINPFAFVSKREYDKIREVERFGSEEDILAKKLRESGPLLDHSLDYLDWRYFNHPNNKYTFFVHEDGDSHTGFAVVRKTHVMNKDIVLVMELWGLNRLVEIRLLRHVAAWSIVQGQSTIVMMNAGISFGEGFSAAFLPLPSILLSKRQVLVVYTTGQKAKSMIEKKWKVQTGDWDVF